MTAPRVPTYPADRCPTADRHKHSYQVPASLAACWVCRRRDLVITHGGSIPARVDCTRCGKEHRTATAYERGRESARTS